MRRKTREEFIKEIHEKFGDEYTVLGNYINNHTLILVRHNECGHEWESRPLNMTKEKPTRCPKCYGTHLWTKEEFVEKLNERTENGSKYTVVGPYVNNSTNIALECNNCKQVIDWYCPRTLLANELSCPFCSDGTPGLLNEKIIKYRMSVQELDKEYEYITHYVKDKGTKRGSTYLKLKHKCEKCDNHEFDVYHNNFLVKHTTCPKCNEMTFTSKLENIATFHLDKTGVQYQLHHYIGDCVSVRRLPFDLYISDNNLLIELDGKQHFNGYNDNEKLKIEQQSRDRIKDKYCIDNNLTLLRIAYTQIENLGNILDDFIGQNDISGYGDIMLIREGETIIANGIYSDLQ